MINLVVIYRSMFVMKQILAEGEVIHVAVLLTSTARDIVRVVVVVVVVRALGQ